MALATLNKRLKVLLTINAIFIAVFILNLVLQGKLFAFGIIPRDVPTIWHVFTSPFIHASVNHLFNNMISFSMMAAVCLLGSISRFYWNSLFIIAAGGLLVWAFGRDAFHVGASGWIFGLWALALATAWFDRKFIHLVVALGVIIFQSGMYLGLIPGQAHVSYEAHIAGAVAGVLCAFLNGRLR